MASRFTLKDRKRWARWKASLPGSSIRDPEALARARGDGRDDEEIAEFLESGGALPLFEGEPPAPALKKCDRTCKLCFGTGQQIEAGKGARKCPNMTAGGAAASGGA